MSTTGERIKARRKSLKLSQVELAKKSGLSQQGISGIESGRSSPSEATIKLLANALSVSISELLEDSPNEKKPATSGDGQKDRLNNLIDRLVPDEYQRVADFVSGVLSSRKE